MVHEGLLTKYFHIAAVVTCYWYVCKLSFKYIKPVPNVDFSVHPETNAKNYLPNLENVNIRSLPSAMSLKHCNPLILMSRPFSQPNTIWAVQAMDQEVIKT
jgi:hypothetical protein